MRPITTTTLALAAVVTCLVLGGCSDRDLSTLQPAPGNDDPVVFDDTFGAGVDYQAFSGSLTDAVAIDTDDVFAGGASLRITVPGPGAASGTYAGGAFVSGDYRDLTGYDALVFAAKASKASTLDVAGLGNDNTGTSLYTVERSSIALTTEWQQVVIPIPDPTKLDLERGMFFFAEGFEGSEGHTVWFDEVRFASVEAIASPRPEMDDQSIESFVGAEVQPIGTRTTFGVNGEDVTVAHSSHYFDYASSNTDVAIAEDGVITAVGGGDASITATLDTVAVTGAIALTVLAPPAQPAPTPTYPAGDAIALFSDAYDTVPVDTWRAEWSMAGPVDDLAIDGDAVKVYSDLTYAGVLFESELIDATGMTHLRVDVWAPEGTLFRVKLVDFGADGVWNQPLDESELTFNATSDPAFTAGAWSVLDIPLDDFALDSRGNLAQLVFSSTDARRVFVDNVLFHR